MHIDQTVVAIRDAATKTTFREFLQEDGDQPGWPVSTRTRKLVVPFGAEYEFFVRVQDNVRRRIEIWVDGSLVNDLIISPGDAVIERFRDSTRRFKFVQATDGAVTDPTNPFNGKVMARVYREQPTCFSNKPIWIYQPPQWPRDNDDWYTKWPHDVYTQPDSGWPMPRTTWTSCQSPTDWAALGVNMTSASYQASDLQHHNSAGATIEGSKSAQIFGSTHWLGDQPGFCEFVWVLSGREAPKAGYCTECGNALPSGAKFCPACGKRAIAA